jgi:hypothetical protein
MQNLLRKEKSPPPPEIVAPVKILEPSQPAVTDISKKTEPHKTHLPKAKVPRIFQFKKYILYLPLLFTSLLLFVLLRFIFQHIEPSFFKDIFIPNFYLPVVLLFATATFFGATYLLMNVRRGLLIAIGSSLFLVAQTHHITPLLSLFFIFVPMIAFETFLTRDKTRR